jgi:hypothetical protein
VTLLAGVVMVVLLAVLAGKCSAVRAHDPYDSWKIPGTAASCCDNRDCRPTRARMTDRETWQAWDGARWLDIPPDRVLRMKSPDGRSHLCEMNGVVLCFVPGPVMH